MATFNTGLSVPHVSAVSFYLATCVSNHEVYYSDINKDTFPRSMYNTGLSYSAEKPQSVVVQWTPELVQESEKQTTFRFHT